MAFRNEINVKDGPVRTAISQLLYFNPFAIQAQQTDLNMKHIHSNERVFAHMNAYMYVVPDGRRGR